MTDIKTKSAEAVETRLTPSRRHVSKAELEEQVVAGIIQIQAVDNADLIPNEIDSTPPKPMEVRPEELWVDRRYQRGHLSRKSQRLIFDIIGGWDWTKFKAPVVTRDDQGRFLVIDGQHTAVAAASHPDIVKIPVMLVALKNTEDQARSFIGHNTDRVNVPSLDLYHARIAAGDPLYVEADTIMKEHGISVVRSISGSSIGQTWTKNQTVATQVLVRQLRKLGSHRFTAVVEFLAKCEFTQIRADHWRFAAKLLNSDNERHQMYTPEMMLPVIKATNEIDAFTEARRMSTTLDRPLSDGLLLFYQLRFREFYKIR